MWTKWLDEQHGYCQEIIKQQTSYPYWPEGLNQPLQRPCHPQPTIEDILSHLSKAKVFVVLNAKDGFWQLKLKEESSYLRTFWSPCGRLRWLQMPFGINAAPEQYQIRQTEHVSDLLGVAVIAYDHLVLIIRSW